jgi:hypothetical protein
MFHGMFHGMFLYYRQSGPGRVQGTKNETLALQDPQQVSKPKYEATALPAHQNIGYPNSTTGSTKLESENSKARIGWNFLLSLARPTRQNLKMSACFGRDKSKGGRTDFDAEAQDIFRKLNLPPTGGQNEGARYRAMDPVWLEFPTLYPFFYIFHRFSWRSPSRIPFPVSSIPAHK